MTAANFDKTLKAMQRRKPFRPFRIRFVDGEHVDVTHPEAVTIQAGVGVHVNSKGELTLFDHEGVSEVVDKNGGRKK
jgi:hypothetical protein